MYNLNPYLPKASSNLNAFHTKSRRKECGTEYYVACLELSNSYWVKGKQAQAILQINKAFLANITFFPFQPPYAALKWFLENRLKNKFIGNPVRHFQHLATRMNNPRKQLRTWRAWACFIIAESVLPRDDFPRDEEQIKNEKLVIPDKTFVAMNLKEYGLIGEAYNFISVIIN